MEYRIKMVYHLYLNGAMSTDNAFFNIHRKCLKKYHDLFEEALFCIALDDTSDSQLIKMGVDFIMSCGPWKNLTIKIKQNTVYGDAQTFYDEIVSNIDNLDSMIFFAHGKGIRKSDEGSVSQRQWVVFSYYACLDNVEKKAADLANYALVYGYAPTHNKGIENTYHWFYPGTFFLFNPLKVSRYLKQNGMRAPKLEDRYSAERFWGNIYDVEKGANTYTVNFDNRSGWYFFCQNGVPNFYGINQVEFLKSFLGEDRTKEYVKFYEDIENEK